MMSWQTDFASHTTGVAFFLKLSHDMASCLAYIADYDANGRNGVVWRNRTGRDTFIPTMHSLKRRGLVEYNEAARIVGMTTPHVKLRWIYRLTPAGKHVLELLKLAYLVEQPERVEIEQGEK